MAKHTMGRKRRPDNSPISLEWLLSNAAPEPNSGCWLWEMGVNEKGYGKFNPSRGKTVAAHRAVYELSVGPVPIGLVIDHLCRNPGCVNPNHLEPVTNEENMRRGKLGVLYSPKLMCANGHVFGTEHQRVPGSKDKCSTCRKIIVKKWNDLQNRQRTPAQRKAYRAAYEARKQAKRLAETGR